MPSSKLHPLLIAAGLVALVAVNLAVMAGLLWLLEESLSRPTSILFRNVFPQIGFGMLIAQVILVGYWLGLGDGRWYLRLVAAITLTLATALAIHCAEALSPAARRQGTEGPWAIMGFVMIAMMLAVSFCGFVLRRIRGWRLTWHKSIDLPAIHQFQIADGLLWMVIISGALAAMRFVVSIEESTSRGFLEISLMTARMAIVVLASMMTAFSTTRQIRTVLLLFALVTAIGIGFAIPDVYRGVERARAFVRGPIAWHDYVSNAMHDGLGQVVFVWTAMCLTLANCLALRFAGCHLIRPAENARRALS